jgi:hypothetical protein
VITVVDVADAAPPERLHDAHTASGFCRRHQQVNVIGHEHIGVNGAVFGPHDLAKVVPIALVVDGGEEARLPIVAALYDVARNMGEIETGLPGNDGASQRNAPAWCDNGIVSVEDRRDDVQESRL